MSCHCTATNYCKSIICSKFIVDTLHEMGLCCSYTEVIRFDKNEADCVEPDVVMQICWRCLSSLPLIMFITTLSLLTEKGHFMELVPLCLSPLENGRTISFREHIYHKCKLKTRLNSYLGVQVCKTCVS